MPGLHSDVDSEGGGITRSEDSAGSGADGAGSGAQDNDSGDRSQPASLRWTRRKVPDQRVNPK